MKIFKWIVGIVVGVVLLAVVALGILTLVLDTETIKERVIVRFEQKTGHTLRIDAPIEWSIFPWLGLKLEKVTVGNAPGFGDEPLAAIDVLDVKVGLMPLLEKRIAVDTVVLKGVDINLVRNREGQANWESLTAGKEAGSESDERAAPSGQEGGAEEFQIDLKGIELDDLDLDYVDAQKGAAYHLEDLDVRIGELKPGTPVLVELSTKLALQEPPLAGRVSISTEVTVSGDSRRIDLSALAIELHAEGKGLPEGGVDLKMAGNLALDRQADRLAVSDLSLAGPQVDITGAVSVSDLTGKPKVEGRLALQDTNLRELLALAGVELETADPQALTKVSAQLQMVQEGGALTLKPLEIRLDESAISGYVAIPSFEGPVVRARLRVDSIDLDRYLPPTKEDKPTAGAGSGAGGTAEQPQKIDFTPLRKLDADATIEVGRLKVSGLSMEKVTLTLKAKKGVIRLDPIGALLYQGKLGASARLDVRKDEPAVRAQSQLAGIQIGPLLAALSGKDYLTGTGNLKFKVDTRGMGEKAIRRNLNGDFSVDFRDGAYKGINLAHAIRQAWAAIKGRTIPDDEPKQTDFAELRGTGVIRKGVVTNRDFYLASPVLRVKGKGKVDLVQEKVDYLLTAKVVGSLVGQGGKSIEELKGIPIPVRIEGDLDNPSPMIDVEALAKALAEAKLEEKKGDLLEKAGKKIEKELGVDLLKGFLGR